MDIKYNFTKVPNQLLRHQDLLSGYERLFLIYLLSHKEGYRLTDVQCSDNLGISRGTVPGLRQKLSQEGYIDCWQSPNHGYIYKVILEKVIPRQPRQENSTDIDDSSKVEAVVSAFKTGMEKFRKSDDYSRILENEYIYGNWHKKEYIPSSGDIKNIKQFMRRESGEKVDGMIRGFEENLAFYLIDQIYSNTFRNFKTDKEIVPTISFFLKSKKAYDDLILGDYSDFL